MHKRERHQQGRQRSDTKRFPYEPIFVGGKFDDACSTAEEFGPASFSDASVVEIISDEMRAVAERLWPELVTKLPPRTGGPP